MRFGWALRGGGVERQRQTVWCTLHSCTVEQQEERNRLRGAVQTGGLSDVEAHAVLPPVVISRAFFSF